MHDHRAKLAEIRGKMTNGSGAGLPASMLPDPDSPPPALAPAKKAATRKAAKPKAPAKAETAPKAKKVKAAPKTDKSKAAKPRAKKAEAEVEVVEVPAEPVATVEAEPAAKPKRARRRRKPKANGAAKSKPKNKKVRQPANPVLGFGELAGVERKEVGVVRFCLKGARLVRVSKMGSFISIICHVDGGYVLVRLFGRDLQSALRQRNPFVSARTTLETERWSSGAERIVIRGELTDERATFGLTVHHGRPEQTKPGLDFLMGVPFTGGNIEGFKLGVKADTA